jgi:hypothetical protein
MIDHTSCEDQSLQTLGRQEIIRTCASTCDVLHWTSWPRQLLRLMHDHARLTTQLGLKHLQNDAAQDIWQRQDGTKAERNKMWYRSSKDLVGSSE